MSSAHSMPLPGPVVSPEWLLEALEKRLPTLLLLDSTWDHERKGAGQLAYESSHIEGARHFDLDRCVLPTPQVPRNLPEPGAFESYARSLGVRKNSLIVVYDQGSMWYSSRTWWNFRAYGHEQIAVLDGGLQRWKSLGFPFLVSGSIVADDKVHAEDSTLFTVNIQPNLLVDFNKMCGIVKAGSAQIADVRMPVHFSGQLPEPSEISEVALKYCDQPLPEGMKSGHMPNAVNIDLFSVADPGTGCLLEKSQLKEIFHRAGIDLSKPLVMTCYIGHTACTVALAAAKLGKLDVAVYYGSWTEWGQSADDTLVVKSEAKY